LEGPVLDAQCSAQPEPQGPFNSFGIVPNVIMSLHYFIDKFISCLHILLIQESLYETQNKVTNPLNPNGKSALSAQAVSNSSVFLCFMMIPSVNSDHFLEQH
jgi:hypothetical protein